MFFPEVGKQEVCSAWEENGIKRNSGDLYLWGQGTHFSVHRTNHEIQFLSY